MKSLSDILPFWHLQDSLMIFKDGSFGTGFNLGGLDLTCKTADEINILSERLQNLFLSLDEELSVQLYFKVSSLIDKELAAHKECSYLKDDNINLLKKERIDFLTKRSDNKEFFSPNISLFLRTKATEYSLNSKSSEAGIRIGFLKRQKEFLSKVKEISSLLESAKLSPTKMKEDEYFSHIFEALNPTRMKLGTPRYDSSYPVNSSLALTDIKESENSIKIGEKYYQIITMKMPPENETYISMIKHIINLPFHFHLSQNFKVLDQKAERSSLELKRRLAFSMASSTKNVSDIESESKLSQIEDLLEELIQGSTKLVNFDFNLIIWGNSEDELKDKAQVVLKTIRELDRSEGVVETYTTMEAYIKSLPSVCESFRPIKLKSSNCAHLIPVYGKIL